MSGYSLGEKEKGTKKVEKIEDYLYFACT